MSRANSTIGIIGAGVVGVSTAYVLAREGYDVVLIDAQSAVGEGASSGNGGQLTWECAEPVGTPALFRRFSQILSGRDQGMAFTRQRDLGFYLWCLQLLLNARQGRSLANTRHLLNLCDLSRREMTSLLRSTSIEFGYRVSGKLSGVPSRANIGRVAADIAQRNALGANYHLLDWAAAQEVEGGLREYVGDCQAAVYCPTSAVGDAKAFCRELTTHLVSHWGIRCRLGHTVVGLAHEKGHIQGVITDGGNTFPVDYVVVATASVEGGLAPYACELPATLSVGGCSLTLPAKNVLIETSFTDVSRAISFSKVNDSVRVTGFFDIPKSKSPESRFTLLRHRAQEAFPTMSDSFASAQPWYGVRAITPSSQPIISRSRRWPGLYFNVGHGMLGWTLALGSGRTLANLISERA